QVPLSVALGELCDWSAQSSMPAPDQWTGVSFCKIGLAGAPRNWTAHWSNLRRCLSKVVTPGPAWVAVVYIDWQAARAPDPTAVIRAARDIDECRGVLFDTWDKTRRTAFDLSWKPLVDRVRAAGKFVALAGSLDIESIRRLSPLEPHIFAVR